MSWFLNDSFYCTPLLTTEWSPFAAYTAAETPDAFQWAGQIQKNRPFLWGISGSRTNLKHGSLGPRESSPKPHLDGFSRFCRIHKVNGDLQTDRDTHTHTHTRPHYSVCSSSQHLAIAAIIIIKLLRFLSFLYHATHSTTCASRHVCLSVRLSVCHARCIVWKRLNQAVNAGWIS